MIISFLIMLLSQNRLYLSVPGAVFIVPGTKGHSYCRVCLLYSQVFKGSEPESAPK